MITRDRALIATFLALAVAAGGIVTSYLIDSEEPPPAVVSRDVAVGPDGTLSIHLVGDTMLGGEIPALAAQRGGGYHWPFDAIRQSTSAADYVVAVAEAPLTDLTTPFDPSAPSTFFSVPEVAKALADSGVDALSLATDHVFDAGPDGLADTLDNAGEAGLATVGAGPDRDRAEQPLLLRSELGTVAVVAMGESFGHRARRETAGTMVLSPEAVRRGADIAREAGADWVVAAVHWGGSYAPIEAPQRYWAEQFAAAGYDLVVGSGPHIAQPIEIIGSTPVVYSTGNFAYGTNGRYAQLGVPGYGLSAGIEVSRDEGPRLAVRCIQADTQLTGFQPRPCTPAEAQAFLPTLNPQLTVRGDVATLPCAPCFAPDEDT